MSMLSAMRYPVRCFRLGRGRPCSDSRASLSAVCLGISRIEVPAGTGVSSFSSSSRFWHPGQVTYIGE